MVKFGDIWLAPRQGTDAALALAMGHVILTEFHNKGRSEYFDGYCRQYNDMPMLVLLKEHEGRLVAERMGWLPSAPQLVTNPLEITRAAGIDPVKYAVEQIKSGALKFSCEDPDNPKNFPRNLFVWRSNLLGSSGKGHEYFLKYLLGTQNAVMGPDLGELNDPTKPREVVWLDKGAEGRLDLLVTPDFCMSTTCLYSGIVLPSATWYEKDDLNTSDMHPFIHPLSEAVQPLCESKSDWEIYKTIARKFSELAAVHLGTRKDLVLTPLMHDTPSELGQSLGVRDWKKGEVDPIPGKTMPGMTVVTRTITKPTHMIGGYAQQAYGFNCYGTVGSNRDEYVIVRKMKKVEWMEAPLAERVK